MIEKEHPENNNQAYHIAKAQTRRYGSGMNAIQKKQRSTRARSLIRLLKKHYSDASMILRYSNHWELLVAVMLSAQCTDKKVNDVTKRLFVKYRTLDDYINADMQEFEQDIFSTGFYKNKTKNILGSARMVRDTYSGVLPNTMSDLLTLPGVARKTANVVLGNAFGIVEGIAVDTHVRRFAIRFDLSDHTDPVRIEKDLMNIMPRRYWFLFTYLVIAYGRSVRSAHVFDPLLPAFPGALQRWILVGKK